MAAVEDAGQFIGVLPASLKNPKIGLSGGFRGIYVAGAAELRLPAASSLRYGPAQARARAAG